MLRLDELEKPRRAPEYNLDKPSRAVVVYGEGDGAVVWTVGGHVRQEIESVGGRLDDLGLEPPGPGVWVWEGKGHWTPGPYECPADGDYELRGTWRQPTRPEWEALRAGRCPWNDEAWRWPGRFTRAVLQLAHPSDEASPPEQVQPEIMDELYEVALAQGEGEGDD